MNGTTSHETTVFALVAAAVLANIPEAWLGFASKLLVGFLFAVVSGFGYTAGKWAWDMVLKKGGWK